MYKQTTSYTLPNGKCCWFWPAILFALLGLSSAARADKSPYDWAFVKLDYARQEKVEQLQSFCERIHTLAIQAAKDKFVIGCFDINLQYSEAMKTGQAPEALVAKVAELREGFNRYYIENYLAFYDVLFVNMQGKAFYTIRKESDLNIDLSQKDSAHYALTHCLSKCPQNEVFIDFHYYEPSSEPAAFFVEPIRKDGVQVGWVILQCAINKINTLLAWTENLGQTGETFLVNQDGYMLTESSFDGSSTILKKRLDDRNIQAKFADKQGHRTVTDYRGHTALSSFKVVRFLKTNWLVVAKIDKDEIATEHYAQHSRYYGGKLMTHLKKTSPAPLRNSSLPAAKVTLRVDMDEFLKADNGERLHTFGVSTCTGLLASYPGKLAYLAHVSPKDKMYGSGDTNLLGQMIKIVKSFNIYRSERHRVVFVIVAMHLNSLLAMVDKLVEEGFLLSQIRVVYNPQATSAAISYDYAQDYLNVSWRMKEKSHNKHVHLMEDADNVGEIIQQIMYSEKDGFPQETSSGRTSTTPKA